MTDFDKMTNIGLHKKYNKEYVPYKISNFIWLKLNNDFDV